MKKVCIIDGDRQYAVMFYKNGFEITSNPVEADLICFTGGEDVSPELYGEKPHPYATYSRSRDAREKLIFQEAVELSIPMVGICRGGQFLNVMNGGKMFQHVEGHGRPHMLTDCETEEKIFVSSTHHQMMRAGPSAITVAVAYQNSSKEHMPEVSVNDWQPIVVADTLNDTEVLFYPHSSCLCFQPHPEYVRPEYARMTEYFFELIHRFFFHI